VTAQKRRPLPLDFHPPLASFKVVSDDIHDGSTLGDALVYAKGNTSPHLRWEGFPQGARSFAVTCYDPDAPTGSGFWHWTVFDIPVTVAELPTGAGTGAFVGLPEGAVQVRNDYGTKDFCGAAPPPGDDPHRYLFTVYAVDTETLRLSSDVTPAYVGFNLRFHAIGRAQLIGEYAEPAAS
jgi:Raf kinase inhibitor-like YbhB/YbcL family protein